MNKANQWQNSLPRVSVIMPVYNGEQHLREAIESILSQTFTDFELLILFDHSADHSLDIIRSFEDQRIRLVVNENKKGLAYILNKGLELSTGEYIARMDCDDISFPRRLEKQVRFMDENPDVGVCGTWIELFMGVNYIKKYPLTHEAIRCNLLFECSLAHPSVMIRKESFLKHDLFYDVKYVVEDYELWTRCSNVIRLANLPEVLVKYRWHFDQVSKINADAHDRSSFEISAKHLSALYKINSENEASIHKLFFPNQYIPSIDMLVKGHEWLCKLSSENAKKHVFSEPEFNTILAERWLFSCKEATYLGFRVFILYWRSAFRKPAAQCFVEAMKLLLKCLLRIDRRQKAGIGYVKG